LELSLFGWKPFRKKTLLEEIEAFIKKIIKNDFKDMSAYGLMQRVLEEIKRIEEALDPHIKSAKEYLNSKDTKIPEGLKELEKEVGDIRQLVERRGRLFRFAKKIDRYIKRKLREAKEENERRELELEQVMDGIRKKVRIEI